MISFPERLPLRISPCPIVEAIFEVRFGSTEPWATLPGLLYARIRERYPEQVSLPLMQVPEQIRAQDPALQNLPLLRFKSEPFLVQLGPKTVSLVTKQNSYPGWPAVRTELVWLLEQIQAAGFVLEIERLGVRYIDFFGGDLFPNLRLDVHVDGQPLTGTQKDLTTVFRFARISARLNVTNGAIVAAAAGMQAGSVLDVDAWVGPQDAGRFEQALEQFAELHETTKRLFFALLKPDYLAQLNPVYS